MSQVLQNSKQAKESSFVHTEEFKNAVQSTVKEILSNLNLDKPAPVQSSSEDSSYLIKSLAHELRTMSGQDNGKTQIAPEIMEKRALAAKKMNELLKQHKAKDKDKKNPPRYRAVAPTYFGNRLYEPNPDKTFGWYGAPNEAVIPMNDVARQIYDLFKQSVGLPHDPIPEEAHVVDKYGIVKYDKAHQVIEKYSISPSASLLVDDEISDPILRIEDMVPPCEELVD